MGSESLVLDVGLGVFATYLVEAKQSMVVGLDVSKRLLCIAKDGIKGADASNRLFLILGSADFLPLRDACFDGATSMLTIHHLPPPRIQESFKEIQRVLKKGGRFILAEDWAYEPKNEFQRIVLELRRLLMLTETEEYHQEYREYVAMLENAGLRVVDVQFRPRPVLLSRFEHLTNERTHKLLRRARQFDERDQLVDTTIISSIK